MTRSYPDLAAARHWNSWQSEYPAQMMHLPLGLTVAVAAYSGAKNSFTDFPANKGQLTYGPRDVTGRQIGFTARHGGTVFGPRPRSYAFAIPKKKYRIALQSALSAKLAERKFDRQTLVRLTAPVPGMLNVYAHDMGVDTAMVGVRAYLFSPAAADYAAQEQPA